MSELFPVDSVKMDSPRLAWIKREGVLTWHSTVEPQCWYAAFRESLDEPSTSTSDFFFKLLGVHGDSRCGVGDTEDEAIADLATRAEIRLWNEEKP